MGLLAQDKTALFNIVRTYAGFGNHHTGTDADAATTAWLASLLEDLGATVAHQPFSFDRFVCRAELIAGGQHINSLPLFYSATGNHTVRDLALVHAPASVVGNARGLDPFIADIAAPGIVVCIDGPPDLPLQCNRVPHSLLQQQNALNKPAVIVAAANADRVASGAELRFQATLEPATSSNLVATFGPADAPPVQITTPLTGWTPAAGERGTGLAAAIAIAQALSEHHRVELSICSGHELDHLGLRHHLSGRSVVGAKVIHLGASVGSTDAASTAPHQLAATRFVLTSATGAARHQIVERSSQANWTHLDIDPPWPGEGGTWVEAGASVLSFLGGSPHFHVETDTPERATTAEAVGLATQVALDAAEIFLGE